LAKHLQFQAKISTTQTVFFFFVFFFGQEIQLQSMNCKKLMAKHRFRQSSFPAPKRKFKAFIWNAVIIYIMFFICTRIFLWTKNGRCSQVLQRRTLLLYLNSKMKGEAKTKFVVIIASRNRYPSLSVCQPLIPSSFFVCCQHACCRARSVVLPLPPSSEKNYKTIWNSVFNFGLFNPRTLIF